jgi:hypothetical protein
MDGFDRAIFFEKDVKKISDDVHRRLFASGAKNQEHPSLGINNNKHSRKVTDGEEIPKTKPIRRYRIHPMISE